MSQVFGEEPNYPLTYSSVLPAWTWTQEYMDELKAKIGQHSDTYVDMCTNEQDANGNTPNDLGLG